MLLHLNQDLLQFVDKMRGTVSRPVYILTCVRYVRSLDISVEQMKEETSNHKEVNNEGTQITGRGS